MARRTAEWTDLWWRELQIPLVAYSGMRWGEHAGPTARQIDPDRRQIRLDRQVAEASGRLLPGLPEGRRCRTTVYPAFTPAGIDLAGLVEKRLAELESDDTTFPAPKGGWLRRSNDRRQVWDPACDDVEWPWQADGHWLWKSTASATSAPAPFTPRRRGARSCR